MSMGCVIVNPIGFKAIAYENALFPESKYAMFLEAIDLFVFLDMVCLMGMLLYGKL